MTLTLKRYYGDCEGPFGFPMFSAAAKEVEQMWSALPHEVRELGLIRRGQTRSVDVSDGERADVSFVTTNALDRDAEVILPQGGDWKQFRKNPVVPFGHDYGAPPVGRAMWVKREQKASTDGWLAKTEYMPRPDSHPQGAEWFPDTVFAMIKGGYLPGKSIGFIPLNFRAPEEKEIRANPSWAKARGVIDKWLALEYSVVPVQSNPEALVQSVAKASAKGIRIGDEFLERIGLMLPESIPQWQDIPVPAPPTTRSAQPQPKEVPFTVVRKMSQEEIRAAVQSGAQRIIGDLDAERLVRRALEGHQGRV